MQKQHDLSASGQFRRKTKKALQQTENKTVKRKVNPKKIDQDTRSIILLRRLVSTLGRNGVRGLLLVLFVVKKLLLVSIVFPCFTHSTRLKKTNQDPKHLPRRQKSKSPKSHLQVQRQRIRVWRRFELLQEK